MVDWEKLLSPAFWGSYRIPAAAFGMVALLLLFRNVSESLEFIYIQQMANYALGATIISYGHHIFYSNWTKRHTPDPDLPFWAQGLAMAIHLAWFAYFLWRVTL